MSFKVLIAEDDPVSGELARVQLSKAGYDVSTARDGLKALEAVKESRPDLILLDVEMPNMNGYTFMSELKKMGDEFKSIPVVVLTSHDNMEPIFKRHGVKDYLVKPLNLQRLLTKAEELLGSSSGGSNE